MASTNGADLRAAVAALDDPQRVVSALRTIAKAGRDVAGISGVASALAAAKPPGAGVGSTCFLDAVCVVAKATRVSDEAFWARACQEAVACVPTGAVLHGDQVALALQMFQACHAAKAWYAEPLRCFSACLCAVLAQDGAAECATPWIKALTDIIAAASSVHHPGALSEALLALLEQPGRVALSTQLQARMWKLLVAKERMAALGGDAARRLLAPLLATASATLERIAASPSTVLVKWYRYLLHLVSAVAATSPTALLGLASELLAVLWRQPSIPDDRATRVALHAARRAASGDLLVRVLSPDATTDATCIALLDVLFDPAILQADAPSDATDQAYGRVLLLTCLASRIEALVVSAATRVRSHGLQHLFALLPAACADLLDLPAAGTTDAASDAGVWLSDVLAALDVLSDALAGDAAAHAAVLQPVVFAHLLAPHPLQRFAAGHLLLRMLQHCRPDDENGYVRLCLALLLRLRASSSEHSHLASVLGHAYRTVLRTPAQQLFNQHFQHLVLLFATHTEYAAAQSAALLHALGPACIPIPLALQVVRLAGQQLHDRVPLVLRGQVRSHVSVLAASVTALTAVLFTNDAWCVEHVAREQRQLLLQLCLQLLTLRVIREHGVLAASLLHLMSLLVVDLSPSQLQQVLTEALALTQGQPCTKGATTLLLAACGRISVYSPGMVSRLQQLFTRLLSDPEWPMRVAAMQAFHAFAQFSGYTRFADFIPAQVHARVSEFVNRVPVAPAASARTALASSPSDTLLRQSRKRRRDAEQQAALKRVRVLQHAGHAHRAALTQVGQHVQALQQASQAIGQAMATLPDLSQLAQLQGLQDVRGRIAAVAAQMQAVAARLDASAAVQQADVPAPSR